MIINEITVFKPNSRAKATSLSSPMQGKLLDVVSERLGDDMAKKAKTAFKSMNRNGFDALSFKLGDRRVKVRQTEA